MDGQHQGVESSSALRAHLATLSRWRLAIAICVVTIPVAAYVWSNDKPAVFEGAVQLKVQPSTVDTSLLNDFNQVFSGPAPALAAAREIKTTAVAEEAIGRLPPGFASTSAALGLITVQVAPDSGIVTLVARGSSGQRAAALANAFARSFVERRLRSATRLLDSAIARLNVQRERLKASAAVERRQLSDQIQRFRALRASQGNNASIIEPAHAATSPVSPHPRRTAAVASLVGLLLALLLVRLLTALDRKVRSQEEVERIMDAPVIATVPEKTFSADPGGTVGREAWETLRANLMFFAIDKVISSVLVTSPQMGDGKTTVASNLAVSYALLGKDVILVDADLRRPQVATKFGLSAGAGFTDVLFGEISAVNALVDIDLAAGQGRLRVLASGKVPPNPSELLASSTAQKVFRDLEEQADILVIDSPPITVVSDAVPLLDLVSGVLAVVLLHGTDRQRLQRFRATLQTNKTWMLGVALTGVSSRSYGYGYGYGYGGDARRDTASAPRSSPRRPAAKPRRDGANSRNGRSRNGEADEALWAARDRMLNAAARRGPVSRKAEEKHGDG